MASLNLFQASSKLDAIRKNLTPIGNFTATQHKVEGMVWALNDSIIIIENFVYDGKGFGVFMHVGKSLMTSHNVNPLSCRYPFKAYQHTSWPDKRVLIAFLFDDISIFKMMFYNILYHFFMESTSDVILYLSVT